MATSMAASLSAPLPAVLHVVDSLEFGGLERVAVDLAVTQHRRGHTVAVFSINATQGLVPELIAAGVPVIQGNKQGTLDLHVLRTLRRAARDLRADVVHAHNFVPNYYAATALLGMWRTPVQVGTCHDMGQRLQQRQLRWMYKASLLRTRRVAMVGQQVHSRFVGQGYVKPQHAVTVMNGVPVAPLLEPAALRTQARAALGLQPDDLVIGAVGRQVELKNHALLIRILPQLCQQFARLKLVLIGAGPLQESLQHTAAQLDLQERVVFAGQRTGVKDLLHAFDVFAMPSLTEGLSIALLEAAAAQLPILATAVGGNSEIITDGQTGLLVPAADEAATQAALRRLLSDATLRTRLAQAARHWVSRHASLEVMCDAYAQLYAAALKR
jgi:glycosyltransferase involved in cell wall biosynthesis